jgi:GTP-binding protein EngB required for normal cell division
VVVAVVTLRYYNTAQQLAVVVAVMDMKAQEPQEQVDKEMLVRVAQVLVAVVVVVQEPQDQHPQAQILVVQVV